jgi:hypothetical protein
MIQHKLVENYWNYLGYCIYLCKVRSQILCFWVVNSAKRPSHFFFTPHPFFSVSLLPLYFLLPARFLLKTVNNVGVVSL